jgi:hypothetical protein
MFILQLFTTQLYAKSIIRFHYSQEVCRYLNDGFGFIYAVRGKHYGNRQRSDFNS